MSHPPPEIASADLAGFALDLAQWGADRPAALAFLSPPPEAAFSGARELLRDLGALGPEGRITDHGRRLAELPLHPRLAHMLVVASEGGARDLAADIAALLDARDPIRGSSGPTPADLAIRLARCAVQTGLKETIGSAFIGGRSARSGQNLRACAGRL